MKNQRGSKDLRDSPQAERVADALHLVHGLLVRSGHGASNQVRDDILALGAEVGGENTMHGTKPDDHDGIASLFLQQRVQACPVEGIEVGLYHLPLLFTGGDGR